MPLSINVGGVWKSLSDCKVNVAGVWKQAQEIYCNVGGTWKSVWQFLKVWVSSGDMDNQRYQLSGFGTMTAGVSAGGKYSTSSTTLYATCAIYNGTTWTGVTGINRAAANSGSFGTQNAGVLFLGEGGSSKTEEYNGTSWSIAYNHPLTGITAPAGAGVENAGLGFGGYDNSEVKYHTHKYNGSSWSSTGSLITVRYYAAGFGSQNAAIAAGGYTAVNAAGLTASCEQFNGSTWSTIANLVTANAAFVGFGTVTNGVACGGTNNGTITQVYNGTTWTSKEPLLQTRGEHAGGENFVVCGRVPASTTILKSTENYV